LFGPEVFLIHGGIKGIHVDMQDRSEKFHADIIIPAGGEQKTKEGGLIMGKSAKTCDFSLAISHRIVSLWPFQVSLRHISDTRRE